MSSYLQFGVVCHWAAMAIQVHLICRRWRSPRANPAFTTYSMGLLLTSAVLFVGFRACTNGDYFQLYWLATSIESALGMWVVGELWGWNKFGLAVGILGSSLALSSIGSSMLAFRLEGIVIAAGAFLSLFRSSSSKPIATGVVIYMTFPTILLRLGNPAWTTYIPVFSWILAQAVWLGWLKTPEVTECHATK